MFQGPSTTILLPRSGLLEYSLPPTLQIRISGTALARSAFLSFGARPWSRCSRKPPLPALSPGTARHGAAPRRAKRSREQVGK